MILAKLLLEQPEVLLFDEPTNFLDREHVAWLAGYLSGLEHALSLIHIYYPGYCGGGNYMAVLLASR